MTQYIAMTDDHNEAPNGETHLFVTYPDKFHAKIILQQARRARRFSDIRCTDYIDRGIAGKDHIVVIDYEPDWWIR